MNVVTRRVVDRSVFLFSSRERQAKPQMLYRHKLTIQKVFSELNRDQSFQGMPKDALVINIPRKVDQKLESIGLTSKWLWPPTSAAVS